MGSVCSESTSIEGDGSPADPFLIKDVRQDPVCALGRQPKHGREQLPRCECLEVQQIEMRIAACEPDHCRHRPARIWEQNVLAKFKQTHDRFMLMPHIEVAEWAGEVSTSTEHTRTPGAVYQ